jgi:hypothetical protein
VSYRPRKLALAALLVAVAAPAWALNDEQPVDQEIAEKLCREAGANSLICSMRHTSTEQDAIVMARVTLRYCNETVPRASSDPAAYKAQCDETRAYIKQRWGY